MPVSRDNPSVTERARFRTTLLDDEESPPASFLDRHRFVIILSLLVFSFLLILFWDSVVVSLRAGQQGIYWSRFFGGTSDRLLYDGSHLKFPWDEITIYDSRVEAVGGKIPMLSKDGMQIDVEWVARYRADLGRIPELHRLLGPNYRDKVVTPDVISSMRQILGDFTAEEIYTQDEAPLLAMVETRVKPLIERYPIRLERVQILRLELPQEMAKGIIEKLLYKQSLLAYDFRIEAERAEAARKRIEATGIGDFEKLSGVSLLKYRAIAATSEMAKSPNSKIIIMGTGPNGLPVLLNADK